MKVKISPSRLCGEISAPPSKSYAHRLMICAALAEGESTIRGISESEDMLATLDCIAALGAKYEKCGDTVKICGKTGKTPEGAVLRCRESGSTLRFMIPPALTGGRVRFEGTPRLLERGVGIYEQLLGGKGIEVKKDSGGIEFFGALTAGEYVLRGDVSSQFITGLLFALPLLSGDSVIKILPPVESRAYIDITAAALGSFGVGAAFLGFREAGVKGALLGGVTGLVSFSSIFFTTVLALSPAWPIALCLMAVAGLAGTFTAGFAIDKLLVNERIDKYKNNFKTQVKKQFHEMRLNNDFTETVRRQVFSAFEGLKGKIETETEIILRDTQETLDNLNSLKTEKNNISEREMDRLHSIAEKASAIVSDAYAVRKVISDSLDNAAENNEAV